MKIDPNDPRLTAFALGELEEAERAAVAAQVEASPELKAVVDEIRATGELLSRELATEPGQALTSRQRETIEAAAVEAEAIEAAAVEAQASGAAAPREPAPLPLKRVPRRPQTWLIPTSLAASILIVVGSAYIVMKTGLAASHSSLVAGIPTQANMKGIGTSAKLYANGGGNYRIPPSADAGTGDAPGEPPLNVGSPNHFQTLNNAEFLADANESDKFCAPPTLPAGKTIDDLKRAHASSSATPGVPPGRRLEMIPIQDSQTGDTRFMLTDATYDSDSSTPPVALDAVAVGHLAYGYGGPSPSTDCASYDLGPAGGLYTTVIPVKNRSADEIQQLIDALPAKYTDSEELARAIGAYHDATLEPANRESYDHIVENPFTLVGSEPLSTFSIDVDTASYANVRRFLNQGVWPPAGAVRIEEMVNYFDYDYPVPTGEHPFSVNVEVADCPWNPDHRLARIGLKGYEVIEEEDRPVANLVFLIDVSGSMNDHNKLPLVKQGLKLLVDELADDDRIAIVVYAGASGMVLPSTPVKDRVYIHGALERLSAGGSTNGGAGIELAYRTAEDNFIEGGVNRVILATDGDFNVGTTSQSELTELIEREAETGVFLSVLGFGMGNYQDSTLEKLADTGNGNYAYIDTLSEAQKVLVEQMGGTLVTIAKDVKIQVEFNPVQAKAYRLVGYENRMLAAQDFNDDTKDAGEIGAGHTVTALYEIVPPGVEFDVPEVDPLKYQPAPDPDRLIDTGELMTVKLRYKEPDGFASKLIEVPVTDAGLALADASDDFVFATSVASFGMLLRGSEQRGDFTLAAVAEMASAAVGDDPNGYRSEFVDLVDLAIGLQDSGR